MQIGAGVSFGQTCAVGGLRNSRAVGSGANLSAINFSTAKESMSVGAGGHIQQNTIARHITVTVLFVVVLVAVGGLLTFGLLWKLAD